MSEKDPRIYVCPIPEYGEMVPLDPDDESAGMKIVSDYYVTLPPDWMGEHAMTRDTAVDSAIEKGLTGEFLTFAVSLALADDFRLPGLEGKHERWDFNKIKLEVITWVNAIVYGSYDEDHTVKKKYLLVSPSGYVPPMLVKLMRATGHT